MPAYLIKRLTVLITLCVHLTSALANGDKALLEIIINGENLGVHSVILKNDDVFISTSVFKEWRIKKELWKSQNDTVSLQSLSSHLKYSFDNNAANLIIKATADSFETQVIKASSKYTLVDSAHSIPPELWSAFLNYALDANFSQPKGFDTLNTTWEVGMSSGPWFAFSDFSTNYSTQNESSKTQRNNT
ncbi:MAG: hypothetical protein ACU88J_08640, partial [Gammaproteobacteria bacterium]